MFQAHDRLSVEVSAAKFTASQISATVAYLTSHFIWRARCWAGLSSPPPSFNKSHKPAVFTLQTLPLGGCIIRVWVQRRESFPAY